MLRVGYFSYWSVACAVTALAISAIVPLYVSAQTVHEEFEERVRARVLEVVQEYDRDIMGTGATTTVQELRVELLDGARAGEVATFSNDLTELSRGDVIFVNRLTDIHGVEYITFFDVERRPALLWLALGFALAVVLVAGWHGIRALFSLVISIVAIMFVLVPALLAGYSPAWLSLGISALILGVSITLTHGFNARSLIAYVGTTGAVGVTCLLAYISVEGMQFSGFSSDASVFLNLMTGGTLDFTGLLLGSIIIGLLGVLDDVAITQAAVVAELRAANQSLSIFDLYRRGMRVGRAHVGSLVNTLALAYVGASLPLVLLFAQVDSDPLVTVNQELVAVEIVRIMIGSIGLLLAVPFTTLMAAWYFKGRDVPLPPIPHHCGHNH
jgi:uncharacterized membrane protein